jgi:hypothetical protein
MLGGDGGLCREAALVVFAGKQSARGIQLPLQTPISAARAVELYLTPEHRGRQQALLWRL